MPTDRDAIRSTFPIPANKLRARKAKIILKSPVTWAPLLASYCFFGIGEINAATAWAIVGLSLVGIASFWKMRSRKLDRAVLEELISESNEAQNKHLSATARRIFDEGYPPYASTLGSFLSLKKIIEEALHRDSSAPPNPKVAEIETLVDEITFGVADQLERMIALNRRLKRTAPPMLAEERATIETAGKDISRRIHEAFLLLESTWNDLGLLLDPTTGITPEDTSHARLDHAITRLREEKEHAARIRARMLKDFGKIEIPMDHSITLEPTTPASDSIAH